MRIETIHIDGFGLYRNRRIAGLKLGINVIYGANEAGKTTLLELVRRIMFGFPDGRSNENLYHNTTDANHGGSLFCRLESGEELVIRRQGSTRGGELTVETAAGVKTGATALDDILHISREFFNNVYAVSLTEMQSLNSLDGDEIKGRIYGAGLGFAKTSPGSIKKYFTDAANNFYQERGSKQLLPSLCRQLETLRQQIKNCRQELPQYDQLNSTVSELDEQNRAAAIKLNQLREQVGHLGARRNLYNDWIDVAALRQKLAELPKNSLADDALSRLEKYKITLSQAEEAVVNSELERHDATAKLAMIIVNRELLNQAAAISALQRKISLYENTAKDADELQHRIEDNENRIRQMRSGLGNIFSREQASAFLLDRFQEERSATIRAGIADAEDEIKRLELQQRQEVEMRRRLGLEQSVGRAAGAGWVLTLSLLVTGVVSGGLLFGYSWWAGLAAGVVGLILAWFAFRGFQQLLLSHTSSANAGIDDEIATWRNREAAARADWLKLLAELQLPDNVSPESFSDLIAKLERIREAITVVTEAERQLMQKKTLLEETEQAFALLRPLLPAAHTNATLSAGAELLARLLEQEQQRQQQLQQIEQSLTAASQRLEAAHRKVDSARLELDNFFRACHANDEEQLRRMASERAQRRQLEIEMDEHLRQMKKISGAGPQFEQLLNDLATTDPASIDAEIAAANGELQTLETQYSRQMEQTGMHKNQLAGIASHEELRHLRQQEEMLICQLNDAAREWTVNIAALRVFETVLREYERERQPEVLRRAGIALTQITDGRYTAIYRPLDSNDLLVRDRDDHSRSVDTLSRGTREELYLAMRLGLIAEYEAARTEPLPLVMDDVLVNFDDTRRRATIAALSEFAANRQILVMTCHRHTADEYLAAGGNEIKLDS